MQSIRKLLDYLEHALSAVCIAAFIAMFVLGIATVVFRFLIQSSLAFPDEMIRYLFVWMIALGSGVAFRRNIHAAIGILVAYLPASLKRAALLLSTALCIVFFVAIFWSGVQMTQRVVPQISPALEVSMAWVYGAIPAGMAILLIFAVEQLILQARAPADELLADGQ